MNRKKSDNQKLVLTTHAAMRMQQRGLTIKNIDMTVRYGRRIYTNSGITYFVGRKEVEKMKLYGIDLCVCQNLHVIGVLEDNEFIVLTVFKNKSIRRKPGGSIRKNVKLSSSFIMA